ncbi:MAG: polysaccharide deacetylase family protein [bacterium]|nr:polysaccharide deacetylase family protein [bacterium]
MKRKLIESFFYLCNLIGLNWVFRRINADKIRILMYHGVSKERFPEGYWLLIHLPEFEKQMNYLGRKYHTIAGSDLISSNQPPENAAVITFDDGMRNVFENAVPVLRQQNLSAVCFAVPGLSEREEQIATSEIFDLIMKTRKQGIDLSEYELGKLEFPPDLDVRTRIGIDLNGRLKLLPFSVTKSVVQLLRTELKSESDRPSPFHLMTKKQLVKFASDPLFEIGGHTQNHVTLSSTDENQQVDEITSCLKTLREWGIEPIPLFCYPSGRFNSATLTALKKAGIKAAVSTTDGLQDRSGNRYEMKRVSVGIDTGINEFKARLSGLYYALMGETK